MEQMQITTANIRQNSEILVEELEKGLKALKWMGTTQVDQQSQITWAHESSQMLSDQPKNIKEVEQDSQQICNRHDSLSMASFYGLSRRR